MRQVLTGLSLTIRSSSGLLWTGGGPTRCGHAAENRKESVRPYPSSQGLNPELGTWDCDFSTNQAKVLASDSELRGGLRRPKGRWCG